MCASHHAHACTGTGTGRSTLALKWPDLGLDVEDLYAFDRALGRDVEDLLCITVVCGRYNLYEVAVLLPNFVSVQMHRIWLWRGRELLLL